MRSPKYLLEDLSLRVLVKVPSVGVAPGIHIGHWWSVHGGAKASAMYSL